MRYYTDGYSWFAQEAHAKGLGIGLKNAGELLSSWEGVATQWQKSLVANFDFSVIEACVSLNARLDPGSRLMV